MVVAATINSADAGDTATLAATLAEAHDNLVAVGLAPTSEDPCDLVADSYHSREWPRRGSTAGPGRPASPKSKPAKGHLRWHGDDGGARGGLMVTVAD